MEIALLLNMNTQTLSSQELEKLRSIKSKHDRKLGVMLAISILVPSIIGFVPIKFLPKKRGYQGSTDLADESIASFLGTGYFLIFLFLWIGLMIWAGLATYKNLGIRKDLKDKRKKTVRGIVKLTGYYEGEHYARLKKGTGVSILRFNKDNYRPLQIGDTIDFEVYEHSKLLIQILQHQPKHG